MYCFPRLFNFSTIYCSRVSLRVGQSLQANLGKSSQVKPLELSSVKKQLEKDQTQTPCIWFLCALKIRWQKKLSNVSELRRTSTGFKVGSNPSFLNHSLHSWADIKKRLNVWSLPWSWFRISFHWKYLRKPDVTGWLLPFATCTRSATLPSSHITWCWLTVVHISRLSASLSFREGLGRKILEWKTCYVKGSDCVPAVQLQEKHFNQSRIVRFSCPDRGRSEFFKRLVNVWKAETHAEHSNTELCVVWLKTTHGELTQWFLSQLFVVLA